MVSKIISEHTDSIENGLIEDLDDLFELAKHEEAKEV